MGDDEDLGDETDGGENEDDYLELDDLAQFVAEALYSDEIDARCGIARNARGVLSDIAAKRAIVVAYAQALERYHQPTGRQFAAGEVIGLSVALKALAATYPDRSGWRRDWKVT